METKEQIRNHILKIRAEVSKDDLIKKSEQIQRKLFETALFSRAKNILFYADYNHEVMTHTMIQSAFSLKKAIFCPKVCGDEIRFYRIKKLEDLTGLYKGIQEPKHNPSNDFAMNGEGEHSLVVMPGVAFDQERNRLGYGKGYYDKFLTENPTIKTIAIALECQIVEQIPTTEYDIKPDHIITEDRII